MQEDKRGLPLTTSSSEAAALFDVTVDRYLEYRLDAFEHLKRTLAQDPDFVMAHCLKGCFGMLMGSFTALPMVEEALAAAERQAARVTARERLHVRALRRWSEGDLVGACAAWDEILFAHPHDLLALRLQHFTHFWMGRDHGLRNPVAAVLPHWDESLPGFGYLLSMFAFGLEECGDFVAAERCGRRAVALNPDDLWGVHAVAHVLEMQGRLAEGTAWLTRPEDAWSDRNAMRGHLWWHSALFPLEQGRYDRVLELYDRAVRPGERPFYLELQNAAALLARLEFRGVDVGSRWADLAILVRPRVEDHAILFTDLHNLLVLARAADAEGAQRLVASLERFAGRPRDHEASLVAPLVRPIAEAILAFYQGQPARAVELLLPLRNELQPIGGSHTQRDVFHQLLLEAALSADRPEIARGLAAERVTLRPASVYNWQRYAAVLGRLGEHAAAALALKRAEVAGLS
jgi:tetratricopeptide (TPR) repeat protein